jgi:uncharacterized coiled-coil DUF342 family protein
MSVGTSIIRKENEMRSLGILIVAALLCSTPALAQRLSVEQLAAEAEIVNAGITEIETTISPVKEKIKIVDQRIGTLNKSIASLKERHLKYETEGKRLEAEDYEVTRLMERHRNGHCHDPVYEQAVVDECNATANRINEREVQRRVDVKLHEHERVAINGLGENYRDAHKSLWAERAALYDPIKQLIDKQLKLGARYKEIDEALDACELAIKALGDTPENTPEGAYERYQIACPGWSIEGY